MQTPFSRRTWLLAVLVLPTQTRDRWELESYARIPSNDVKYSSEGMRIAVRKSASPLVHPLDLPGKVSGFKITGHFHGLPQFPDAREQGRKGADDYVLRLGLVVPGSTKLTGIRKYLAPAWVKNLYGKIPEGMGLERVQFFNITQNPEQVRTSRVHPNSELIHEEFIELVTKPGPFEFDYRLKKPEAAVALWLSVDGDDTQSSYDVVISGLQLRSE